MGSGSKSCGGSDDGHGIRESQTGGVGEFQIIGKQLWVGGIYVHWAIQSQAACVLIADADFPRAGDFAFDRKIALLGVGELEIFRDWKRERQDGKRKSRGKIILIGEERIGQQGIEALLAG